MKLRIKYNSWFVPRGKKAWVLYPFMIFKDKKEDVTDTLFRHELEHAYQICRDGWWSFYSLYLYYWVTCGYYDNYYERLARQAESTPLTLQEQSIKNG